MDTDQTYRPLSNTPAAGRSTESKLQKKIFAAKHTIQ